VKKILVGLLATVLVTLSVQPVQAEDQKVLAIIDTAIDSSKVPSVIYEACFTISSTMGCPNGKTFKDLSGSYSFSEGQASANSPLWPSTQIGSLGTIYHGYNVTQAALTTSPGIKIVFIRMSGIAKANGMQSADPQDSTSIIRAIKWVSDNAEKYSIDAVSISQSWVTPNALALCSDKSVTLNVSSLTSKNIPVFAATGNNASTTLVGFPSCVNGVTGVGALITSTGLLETATNKGPGLDVVAQNSISIVRYNGTPVDFTATSAATPIAASVYVSKNTYKTFDLFLNSFKKVLGYTYISK
jgi:hypothetical protein